MQAYLIDTFRYNDWANRQIITLIAQMPERAPETAAAIRLFSHLITSQRKWMARLTRNANEPRMAWFEPPYPRDELAVRWHESLTAWLTSLEQLPADGLQREVRYVAGDGKTYSSRLQDIALQLNYHSIHHRAQISLLARQQNLTPPFIDYIGFSRTKEDNLVRPN